MLKTSTCLGKPFQPRLIFGSKVRSLTYWSIFQVLHTSRLQANIKVGQQSLPRTNTLADYENSSTTKEKFYDSGPTRSLEVKITTRKYVWQRQASWKVLKITELYSFALKGRGKLILRWKLQVRCLSYKNVTQIIMISFVITNIVRSLANTFPIDVDASQRRL